MNMNTSFAFMPLRALAPRRVLRVYNWLTSEMMRGIAPSVDIDLSVEELSYLIELLYLLPDETLCAIRAAVDVIIIA